MNNIKYTVINEHTNFDFHDAQINGVRFQDGHMVWDLPVIQTPVIYAPHKKLDEDTCYIKSAVMVLENAAIESIVIGGYEIYDNKGNLIEAQASVPAPPEEYGEILQNISYKNFRYIGSMTVLPVTGDRRYRVRFTVPGHEITITFTKSMIKWDEFAGVTWYRNKRWRSDRSN
ncbi:MAG: hypothetical protein FWE80_06955 [Oscillospiraceae bacterium]|nr:hypothetical protein [Oscillospiraceae bacterium]